MEVHLVATYRGIVSKLVFYEGGQLAEQLDANESTADDDDRQQRAPPFRVGFDVRTLQLFDQMIAQHERIGDRLERPRMLRARDEREVRRCTQGDDHVIER